MIYSRKLGWSKKLRLQQNKFKTPETTFVIGCFRGILYHRQFYFSYDIKYNYAQPAEYKLLLCSSRAWGLLQNTGNPQNVVTI